ncbi:MAG: hypothetical protein LBT27_02200 [Prevotellaceae bacterium]|jgi:hypothetical protein|nr:hypothetical protein [Prevotellaceae bacterium]
MTEIGEIYKKIDLLRASNTLDEIELFLIAADYDEELVKHAIKYVRDNERHDVFVQKELIDRYNPILQMVKIYGCYLLAFICSGYCIYYAVKFVQILTTPFDIQIGNQPSTSSNSLEGTTLTLYVGIFALILMFVAMGLFYLAHRMSEHKKAIENKIQEIKKRYTAPPSKQNESR